MRKFAIIVGAASVCFVSPFFFSLLDLVKSVLEESVDEGKRGCYVKLSPDVKAQIGKRAAERGVAARSGYISAN